MGKKQLLNPPAGVSQEAWEMSKEENTPINPRRDLTIPYSLKYRVYSRRLQSHPLRDVKGLYIGESKYGRCTVKATVFPHPAGLILVKRDEISHGRFKYPEKTVIPGEWGLSRVTDFLVNEVGVREISSVHKVILKKSKEKEIDGFFYGQGSEDPEYFHENSSIGFEDVSVKVRKTELARGLLRSGIWAERGRIDKNNISPSQFWRWVPNKESFLGDHRSAKNWWKDALYRSIISCDNGKKYAQEGIDATSRAAPILQRAKVIKEIGKFIKEGTIPQHPWDIRGWRNVPFETFNLCVFAGLYNHSKWDEWTSAKSPNSDTLNEILRNASGTYLGDFFIPKIDDIEFTEFVNDSITVLQNQLLDQSSVTPVSDNIDNKGLCELVVPSFNPPDGWEWTNDREMIEGYIPEKTRNIRYYTIAVKDEQRWVLVFDQNKSQWLNSKINRYGEENSDRRERIIYERILFFTHAPGPNITESVEKKEEIAPIEIANKNFQKFLPIGGRG